MPEVPGKANRTDLLDSSRLPGETPAGSSGQVAKREALAPQRQVPPPVRGQGTRRPNEPVTAGLPIGAGPGPTPLPSRGDQTIDRYRALLSASRDPVLAMLVGRLREANGR